MEIGHFYFIKDNFYIDFPNVNLMKNHQATENSEHNRPCFYSIKQNNGIIWLIPISSKVEKYKKITEHKILKYGMCDTLDFASVLGKERTFLIQNMLPITSDYISHQYLDCKNVSVEIDNVSKKRIITKAKKVLSLQRKGYNLIFGNVLQIKNELLEKISKHQLLTV